jgi:hypothetical protein
MMGNSTHEPWISLPVVKNQWEEEFSAKRRKYFLKIDDHVKNPE